MTRTPPTRADEDFGDYWEKPWGFGSASHLDQSAAQRDRVAELHAVVEEVTRKPVNRPSRRIGFLP